MNLVLPLVDPVRLREIGVRRRGQTAHVVVDLVRPHLQEALVEVRVHRDVERVDVGRSRTLVELVPLQDDPPVRDPAGDRVRATRRVGVDALRVVCHPQRDRLEERHPELREQTAVRLGQLDDQRVAPRHDAGRGVRRAGDHLVGADDVPDERDGRRLHRFGQRAEDRLLEVLRGDLLAVRELETALDLERICLPVLRHDWQPDGGLRLQTATRGRRLVRIVDELQSRRELDLPGDRPVGERRIGEVDVSGRHVQLHRAALLGGATRGSRVRKACDHEQDRSERGHDGRKPELSTHVTPFQVENQREAAGQAHGMHPRSPKTSGPGNC